MYSKWNQMTKTNKTSAKIRNYSTLICFDRLARCASEYTIDICFKHDCCPSDLSIWGLHRVASPPAVGLLQNLVCETVAFSLSSSLSLWRTSSRSLFKYFRCDGIRHDKKKAIYWLQAKMVKTRVPCWSILGDIIDVTYKHNVFSVEMIDYCTSKIWIVTLNKMLFLFTQQANEV